jgi:predicted nucleic acid-binding protein
MNIVVDTCVFIDGCKKDTATHKASGKILNSISNGWGILWFDNGFHPVKDKNTSRVLGEYYEKIQRDSYPYAVVLKLIKEERYVVVSKSSLSPEKRKVDRIIADKNDRFFCAVALLSHSKILISNEHEDYTPQARKVLQQRLGLSVLEADTFLKSNAIS